jgi:hypothetical protein
LRDQVAAQLRAVLGDINFNSDEQVISAEAAELKEIEAGLRSPSIMHAVEQ